jgi:predicted nucleic acid-binding protein
MIFADIAQGTSVFLDANSFVYHFGPDPYFGPACSQLLERIEKQEIQGITSTHVITETAHRLMTIEAITSLGWPVAGIAARLRRNEVEIKKLIGFRRAVEAVLNSKVTVVTIEPKCTLDAATISQQWGLLSNDAMIIAVMHSQGLTNIASNDADFERVTGITRYSPL